MFGKHLKYHYIVLSKVRNIISYITINCLNLCAPKIAVKVRKTLNVCPFSGF